MQPLVQPTDDLGVTLTLKQGEHLEYITLMTVAVIEKYKGNWCLPPWTHPMFRGFSIDLSIYRLINTIDFSTTVLTHCSFVNCAVFQGALPHPPHTRIRACTQAHTQSWQALNHDSLKNTLLPQLCPGLRLQQLNHPSPASKSMTDIYAQGLAG